MTLSEGERAFVRFAVRAAAQEFDPNGIDEESTVRRLRDQATGFALGALWYARWDTDLDPDEVTEVGEIARDEVSVLRRAVERELMKN